MKTAEDILRMDVINELPSLGGIVSEIEKVNRWQQIKSNTIKELLEQNIQKDDLRSVLKTISPIIKKVNNSRSYEYVTVIDKVRNKLGKIRPSKNIARCDDMI